MYSSYAASRTWEFAPGLRFRWVAFFAAQVILALLMCRVPGVATLHALVTFAVGLWLAAFGRRPEQVAYVGAYIVGSEVIWRIADAGVFWEFGKYAMAAIFLVSVLRFRPLKAPALPLLYFALLLPSTLLTVAYLDSWDARREISFNLSGPFALAVSAWFFCYLKLSRAQVHKLFLTLMGSALGVAAITLVSTLSASQIRFTTESNSVTSGGFGPNQVSSVLGLAALLAFLCLVGGVRSLGLKALTFGGMILFATQSALTFSRGGLYDAAGGVAAASLFLAKDARSLARLIVVMGLLFVLGSYFLVPRLDEFTGGAFVERFSDTDPTHRDEIALTDLQIWKDNPVLGVGPGRSPEFREHLVSENLTAHVEFTRLLAEHGLPGLVAIILLLVMVAQNLRRAPTAWGKALTAALVAWSFIYMLNAAMRMVAPAFVFGVAFATFLREDDLVREPLKTAHYRSLRARETDSGEALSAFGDSLQSRRRVRTRD